MSEVRTPNTLRSMTDSEIDSILSTIEENNMSERIVPITLLLDLSGSMSHILDRLKTITRAIHEKYSDDYCPCRVLLSVLYCYESTTKNPKVNVGYVGFIDNFDIDRFLDSIKECFGMTPLIGMLQKALDLSDRIVGALEKKYLIHTMPVFMFCSDYIENVADNSALNEMIRRIQTDVEKRKRLVVEFNLTQTQARALGCVKEAEEAIHFGGFRCLYDDNIINEFVEALKIATSTIADSCAATGLPAIPPISDYYNYMDYLNTILYHKMQSLWNLYNA